MMNKLTVIGIVSALLGSTMSLSAYGVEKKVVIGFNKAPGPSEISLIEGNQGRVDKTYENLHALSIEIDESLLPELMSNPDIVYIEEDMSIQTIDPLTGLPQADATAVSSIEYDNAWSVSLINAQAAHDQAITGAGVKIAILDTGIDYNHPDLSLNYAGGDNFISLDINNHDPFDDSWNSHGTHVAGTIAARLDGVGVVGVAPDASLYAVKVLDGAGFGTVSSIVAGIDWAITNQMDIVNLSVGMTLYSQALADACDAAEAAGILLVAAAGNTYGGPLLYPAAHPSVIAVGATTIYGDISVLSPIGPEMELVAPGLNVYSTISSAWGGGWGGFGGFGDYGFLGGTSQAAPHVSGLAALLLASGEVVDLDGDGSVDNHDLREQMHSATIDLGALGFDDTHGYGLIDVATAFSGVYPISHFILERNEGRPWENTRRFNIKDGVFDVTIVNTSLHEMKMVVYEGDKPRRDLSEKFEFIDDDVNEDEDDDVYPQQVSFSLDATGTDFTLMFVPKGPISSFADIYIQKQ